MTNLQKISLRLNRKTKGSLFHFAPETLQFTLETHGQQLNNAQQPTTKVRDWLQELEISWPGDLSKFDGSGRDEWEFICLLALESVLRVQAGLRLAIPHRQQCNRIKEDKYQLLLPSTIYTWRPAIEMLKASLAILLDQADSDKTEHAIQQFSKCRSEMRGMIPQNTNTLLFLNAAQELDIPVKGITSTLYRFGWGRSAVLMDSSLTHFTSAIGCNAAKNKLITKKMLFDSGLPVATGLQANSATQAWTIAEKLGLPVVVKPVSADRGLEVHVKLFSKEEVTLAAEAVINSNNRVLIERYHSGNDYRLQIFKGEMFRAVERSPGGITGDGQSSISQLLEALNHQSDRGPNGSGKSKRPIDFDIEAKRLLFQQGLTINSVPNHGQFIPLRSAANISRGGEMRVVTDIVHPDNITLAARAVNALHLDLAGVDILMSDISRSWLEVGGIICEVNAQPQIASGHGALLSKLLGGNGRIPIDAVLGLDQITTLQHDIANNPLLSAQLGLGLIGRDGVFVGKQQFSGPPRDQFNAAETLINCTQVDRIIIAPWDDSLILDGLPFDRINNLATIDAMAEDLNSKTEQQSHQINKLAATLAQMAQTVVSLPNIESFVTLLEDDYKSH